MGMVFEHERDYGSQWSAISSLAGKIGCTPETLRRWVRQTERDERRREYRSLGEAEHAVLQLFRNRLHTTTSDDALQAEHSHQPLNRAGRLSEKSRRRPRWVDWFNHRRLLESIGDIAPAEKEADYYRNHESATAA